MKVGVNKFMKDCGNTSCNIWECKSPECSMCKKCYNMYLKDLAEYCLILVPFGVIIILIALNGCLDVVL